MGTFFTTTSLGARVMSLKLAGVDILRNDDGTNPKRSGIPILGPIVDVNVGIWQCVAPNMPQHGTDRISQWHIANETPISITFTRIYDGIDHPLKGNAEICISVDRPDKPQVFSLMRKTTHLGEKEVPLGTGLHTYFLPHARFPTLDVFPVENNKTYVREGMKEIPMILDGRKFMITTNPISIHTVIWTENAHDHICVEAWWAEIGNAPTIKPDETRVETYTINAK